MARFYSNENFPVQSAWKLRELGHDVLTSLEAGNANQSVPDEQVLLFAAMADRILLTQNRRCFLKLHQRAAVEHAGIVLCTYDPDFERLALEVHNRVSMEESLAGRVLRVYRPAI